MKRSRVLLVLFLVLSVASLSVVLTACSGSTTTTAAPAAPTTAAGGSSTATTALSGSVTTASVPSKPAPEKIRFGCAIAKSGWMATGAALSATNVYDLWVDDVNAAGGIYVKEYDKKIPIEIKYYDDKSDPGTTVKMLEKLILDDKVDFVLAPWSTAAHFAAVPIANQYKYFMLGITVSSNALAQETAAGKYPYYFNAWSPASLVSPHLVSLLQETGCKSAALVYASTLFGIDFASSLGGALSAAGIATPVLKSYPVDIMDFTSIINEMKNANVDAVLDAGYDADGVVLMEQMIANNYNPKLFWQGAAGWGSTTFVDKFGKEAMEGVFGEQVWNPKMEYPGAKEFYDRYVAKWKKEPDMANAGPVYATLQVYQQAIEKAGTLDREKVRDLIASDSFPTIFGDMKFENNTRKDFPAFIGQWHNGEYLMADPPESRSKPGGIGTLIFPKPEWKK